MAKIIIQTDKGEEVYTVQASSRNLRNSEHSLIILATLIKNVMKALDEAFDIDEKDTSCHE